MKTNVQFNHMDRSTEVEEYALKKIGDVVNDFLSQKDCNLQVWLTHAGNHKNSSKYRCEVNVRFAPKNDVFVDKSADDLYEAINLTAASLQNTLRSKIKKQDKRN